MIINGPNLNLLGQRDKQMYGSKSFESYFEELKIQFPLIDLEFCQSNVEGELINFLHSSTADGILINAGGYTHTSVSIRDAIDAINIPVVEIHISNVTKREEFRHTSLISPVCVGCILGFGLHSYALGIQYFSNNL